MDTVATNDKTGIFAIIANKSIRKFGIIWLVTFVLYLPAIKAGWVLDSAGWLQNIRTLSFAHYVNNAQSGIPSLYHFTQITTYILYKLFNANPYAWHVTMVTMHAINAFLFFLLCSRIFEDSGIKNSNNIAFVGVFFYTICPHISEVIVWESAFHYLQGFILILSILLLIQKFLNDPKRKYALCAGLIFFFSTYSLEIFYLTPWFTLTLALYYRYVLHCDQNVFRKTIILFTVPQVLMFLLHIIVLRIIYHGQVAHLGQNIWQPFSVYICKPPRYIFHILMLGRFFPLEARRAVYDAIGSNGALIVFYNIFILVCIQILSRFNNFSAKGKASTLLFAWTIISMGIILPLAFPDMMLMYYDRYTYFLDAFVYMLLVLLISYVTARFVKIVLFSTYAAINIYFTTQINLLWKHSTYIDNRLLHDFENPENKTVILLNVPQCMNGLPMIGADPDGSFKMMYKLFVNKEVAWKIHDAVAYNMTSDTDGAHVYVYSDSLIRVTLNQWGTWWWYQQYGAYSYENEDYKLEMRDMGHWYDIILKRASDEYLLLYQQGEQWKKVNMKKKNEDQY